MSLLFFGIFLFLSILSAGFIWSFKKNTFMGQEFWDYYRRRNKR